MFLGVLWLSKKIVIFCYISVVVFLPCLMLNVAIVFLCADVLDSYSSVHICRLDMQRCALSYRKALH